MRMVVVLVAVLAGCAQQAAPQEVLEEEEEPAPAAPALIPRSMPFSHQWTAIKVTPTSGSFGPGDYPATFEPPEGSWVRGFELTVSEASTVHPGATYRIEVRCDGCGVLAEAEGPAPLAVNATGLQVDVPVTIAVTSDRIVPTFSTPAAEDLFGVGGRFQVMQPADQARMAR